MNAIGALILVAATATSQSGMPHVSGRRLLRPHVVQSGPPPATGMVGGPGMGGMQGDPGAQPGRRFPNTKSQIFFVEPAGMRIAWQTAGGGVERVYLPPQLTTPARYNFRQGFIYRLKLTDIPDYPGLVLYPSIEVAPSTPATDAFLTHNPIPSVFQPEDFDQVKAGNFVTKVLYLPDPRYQELAIAGVETVVSTRLEPGVDPIKEADKRGTILMIVRIGAIDLEMPDARPATGPEATAPTTGEAIIMVPGSAAGTVLPPGAMPGAMRGPRSIIVTPAVPLDAPVSPVAPSAVPPTPAPAVPAPTPAPPAADAPPAVPPAEAPPATTPPPEISLETPKR